MQFLSSGIIIAEVIGGATGAFVVGYLSKEKDKEEIEKNLMIGVMVGSIITALGTALFIANNTGATLGALVGLIAVTQTYYSGSLLKEIEKVVTFMMVGAVLGYASPLILNYAVSSIFHRV